MKLYNRALSKISRITDRAYSGFDDRSIEVLVDEEVEKYFKNNKKIILYVGSKYDYGHREWGLSYEHYNFYHTLLNMEYSLIYFDYAGLKQKYGAEKVSRMLREAVYYYHPHILFYCHYHDFISHSVWSEISNELPTKTVIWQTDDHVEYEETRPVWKLFNLVVTTDKEGYDKRKKEGFSNVLLSQWGCNPFLYRDLNMPRKHDVSFVGRNHGKRKEVIESLKKQGIRIDVFGPGWKSGSDFSDRISQADLIKIYNQSKISLNLSLASKKNKITIKGRDFEVPACGSLLLTQGSGQIEKYFIPGKEIVTYKDMDDAAEKIKYYLKHNDERERIRLAGQKRCLSDHTWPKRFEEIFKKADFC